MDLMEDTFKSSLSQMSNHPPCITKNIPDSVNKRLSALSSDQDMFESGAPTYQEALKKSGYDFKLEYSPTNENLGREARSRKRQLLWFNPSFSTIVRTNIGSTFLNLLEKHFQPDTISYKNTIKLSYRCTPNMATIISCQ